MNTTPQDTNNPVLTPEQTASIEEATRRLYNLQAETASATRVLSALKNDSVVALRDKAYQEELLANVVALVGSATSQLNQLNEQIVSKQAELSDITQKIAVKAGELTDKEAELKQREDNVVAKEAELVTRETSITQQEDVLMLRRKMIEDKIIRINEAING